MLEIFGSHIIYAPWPILNSKLEILAGSSSKSKTGLVIGIVGAFLGLIVLGGLMLFFWRGRNKGYKREVFVDVAGPYHPFYSILPSICVVSPSKKRLLRFSLFLFQLNFFSPFQ